MQVVLDAKSTRRSKNTKGYRNLTLPKTFIHDNGADESTSFSDVTWSRATSKYMEFVNNTLRESSFDKIIEKAKGMMAILGTDNVIDVESYEEVQLVDLSDEDCKF